MNEDDLPESFFCPLTFQIMINPMVDPEGNTYERSAIEDWLKINATSPITRSPLSISNLIPNRALKDVILNTLKEKGINPENIPEIKKKPVINPSFNDNINLSLKAVSIPNSNNLQVLTSIIPDKGKKRSPIDICCVIDVSGSMSTIATFQNDKGKKESHGLTILDIVIHSVETIIQTLEPQDRLSIITYSTTAEIITNLTKMNSNGKKISSVKLHKLIPQEATNLWDGLYKALEILKNNSRDNCLSTIFILTDGEPNINPPRGIVPMLKRYKQRNKDMDCIISTFGFGYSMDSELLNQISFEGNGIYSFIPDSGFVGTTFVNALSNLLVTQAKNVILDIEPGKGYEIKSPSYDNPYPPCFKITPRGASIIMSTLHYGQSRDFIFELIPLNNTTKTDDKKVIIKTSISYQLSTNIKETLSKSSELLNISVSNNDKLEIEKQYLRIQFICLLNKLVKKHIDLKDANIMVKEFLNTINNSIFTSDEYISSLIADIEGQVLESISKQSFYDKWGKHYLPSLARSHLLQQCNNFKDPGIQLYGGELFNEIRDKGDDIFISLPPPKPVVVNIKSTPSSLSSNYFSSNSSSSNYSPPNFMTAYYCSSNPCFSGNSLVHMSNNTLKPCKLIKKGDKIKTPLGITSIKCVIQTICKQGKENMVELKEGLTITPYHPIRINNKWIFPCDIKKPKLIQCETIYSFVLDKYHSIYINNLECVTLGHNFKDNNVVSHPYFGSNKIIKDLKQLKGWSKGLIISQNGCMLKNKQTKLVSSYDKGKQLSIDSFN